jgi:hypothetical protein
MMRMSQEGEWKTKKVSEKNRSYTASATAKRFSSTNEYTDQHITDSKKSQLPKIYLFDQRVVNQFSLDFRSSPLHILGQYIINVPAQSEL